MQIVKAVGVTCLLASLLLGADNPFFGKWKLNVEKSTFAPAAAMKELTMSFEPDGDKIHRLAAGMYVDGKPIEEGGPEGADFAWDGQGHTVHDAQPKVVIACTPVKNGIIHVTVQMDGKLVAQIRAQVSADGQMLTETTDNIDEQGKHSKSVLVFEKQ